MSDPAAHQPQPQPRHRRARGERGPCSDGAGQASRTAPGDGVAREAVGDPHQRAGIPLDQGRDEHRHKNPQRSRSEQQRPSQVLGDFGGGAPQRGRRKLPHLEVPSDADGCCDRGHPQAGGCPAKAGQHQPSERMKLQACDLACHRPHVHGAKRLMARSCLAVQREPLSPCDAAANVRTRSCASTSADTTHQQPQ